MASFTDTFPQANENPLSSSGVWTGGYSTAENLQVVGNRVRPTSVSGFALMTYNGATFNANAYCIVTIATFTGASFSIVMPMIRMGAPSSIDGYYAQAGRGLSWTTRIILSVATVETELASENSTTWVANDLVEIHGFGSAFYARRNGQRVLFASDATITSGGRGGMVAMSGSAVADTEIETVTMGDEEAGPTGYGFGESIGYTMW